jgi:nicotinamide riboside transporter PnuC
MWGTIAQIGLAIFGVTAIILVAKKNKWGFVFGLLSQPFWFISSFMNKQWGIFLLNIIYTFSWSYGIYIWFFKSKRMKLKNVRK